MSQIILRSEVASMLALWQTGTITTQQLHAWATQRYAVSAWEPEDEVVNEVLSELDTIDMNLMIKDDVPNFLQALNAASAEDAHEVLADYFMTIDRGSRLQQLVNDLFYSPFCK